MNSFFSKETLYGLLLGVLMPIISLPLIWFLLGLYHNTSIKYEYMQFDLTDYAKSRHLSLALILNLIWFYFFLNRQKYSIVRGILLAMLLYAPYMIYIYFYGEPLGTNIGQ